MLPNACNWAKRFATNGLWSVQASQCLVEVLGGAAGVASGVFSSTSRMIGVLDGGDIHRSAGDCMTVPLVVTGGCAVGCRFVVAPSKRNGPVTSHTVA